MKILLEIIRGAIIGVANIIPGVSGGTMMVSMGIYDTLIGCINSLFKDFRRCIKVLWPYAVGMVLGVMGLAKLITILLENYELPTKLTFIGLILGSLPVILSKVKGEKKGLACAISFVVAFAIVVGMQIAGEGKTSYTITITNNGDNELKNVVAEVLKKGATTADRIEIGDIAAKETKTLDVTCTKKDAKSIEKAEATLTCADDASAQALSLADVKLRSAEGSDVLKMSVGQVLALVLMGVIASATMVIPGVSGSMMLMLLGYYKPVVGAVSRAVDALLKLNFGELLSCLGVLLPFGIGIVVGIFGVAKLIELLLKKYKGVTYFGILGLVAASPVALLIGMSFASVTWITWLIGAVCLAAGFGVAYKLGGD